MNLKCYVYILAMADGQLYTGSTTDLNRRMDEHHTGKVRSTCHRRPLELIHCEAYALESDARRREQFLKTTEGKRLLRQQIRDCLIAKQIAKQILDAIDFAE